MLRYFFIAFFLLLSPALAASHTSGLPIPRFVSLKSDEVNVRTGPGTRYPIQWVYRRVGMPVEVIDEYDYWRKLRFTDGTVGWVHKSMLSGKRTVMIRGKEDCILYLDPDERSKPILKAEPTVIGQLMECQPEWCRVQISGRKGWAKKKHLWGVMTDEIFD